MKNALKMIVTVLKNWYNKFTHNTISLKGYHTIPVSYTHLDVYKRQVQNTHG